MLLKSRFVILSLISFATFPSWGQDFKGSSKVNLDDVNIKGQSNGRGISFNNRSRYSLADRIKVRKDFRSEISENVPTYFSGSKDIKSYP